MTTWPDVVNGAFELLGGVLMLLNVRRVRRDKRVAGVSVAPAAFFTLWGLWNLFYYQSLGQWCSLAGGVVIVIVNAVWIALALWYGRGKGGE